VYYLTREGADPEHEVPIPANDAVLREISAVDAIIYGVGSLYTSVAPSLVLQGVGEAVAARQVPKILMLNGSHDRETSLCLRTGGPMTAVCSLGALPPVSKCTHHNVVSLKYTQWGGRYCPQNVWRSFSHALSDQESCFVLVVVLLCVAWSLYALCSSAGCFVRLLSYAFLLILLAVAV
jgi:hypothetical protein